MNKTLSTCKSYPKGKQPCSFHIVLVNILEGKSRLFRSSPIILYYIILYIYIYILFVYSPPARRGLLDFMTVVLLLRLLLLLLILHLLSSLSSSFSSTTFASTPMFTSALPTLRQALRQLPHAVGTAGPQTQGSERTGHRWTSTWDPPSSVSTAGPQPGTVRAQ